VRRLAALYPDAVIAGILNRQGRTTARGHRFDNRVASLRTHWRIPCFQPKLDVAAGEIMTVAAAAALNVAPSTLHRWLNDGLIPGEQVTPGAPWRIRMTDELKAKFTVAAGDGFITMQEATRALGVTRQTVLHRVKRGEIEAAHVTKGGKRGLRIKVIESQPTLFSGIEYDQRLFGRILPCDLDLTGHRAGREGQRRRQAGVRREYGEIVPGLYSNV
jgi:hypothetical protein